MRMPAWIYRSALALVLWPVVALAGDGVLEISQACAESGGCASNDTPGFPVQLRAGSYRLTSDLEFDETATIGIELLGSGITLDFNGFRLSGDPGTGVVQTGVLGLGGFHVVTNGRVEDVDGPCLLLGDHARVERMMLVGCGGPGIQVGEHGIVQHDTIFNGAFSGQGAALQMAATTGYGGNQISSTGAGADDVSGGTATGVNLCDGSPCSRFPPLRRYYLAQGPIPGSQALDSCAEGFHMASVWEILNLASLTYDTDLGYTTEISGSGPPTHSVPPAAVAFGWGWVQGLPSNCNGWTDGTASAQGSRVSLSPVPDSQPSTPLDPWVHGENSCHGLFFMVDGGVGVWCIED